VHSNFIFEEISDKHMLQITGKQVEKFRRIKKLFYCKTKFPKANNWQDWDDDDAWWHLVSQVITVGSSLPAQKFEKNARLKGEVAYEKLIARALSQSVGKLRRWYIT
jgi:hypothetical protein